MNFNLQNLSYFRQALMGASTLLILICHSTAYIAMPSFIKYSFSFGNIGVDIFLLLSGFGLYYSLLQIGGLKAWYTKRYVKLFITYLLICLPSGIISWCIGEKDFTELLMWLTTISFWTNHAAAWFIALIIWLYLFAPLIKNFLESNGLLKSIVITIICFLFYIVVRVEHNNDGCLISNIIYNIQFVFVRVPAFIWGMYLGKFIKSEVVISLKRLFLLSIIAVIVLIITKRLIYTYLILLLPVCYIFVVLFQIDTIKRICSFFGNISLESYLLNTIISPWIFLLLGTTFPSVFVYVCSVLLGTFLSCKIHDVSNKLITLVAI